MLSSSWQQGSLAARAELPLARSLLLPCHTERRAGLQRLLGLGLGLLVGGGGYRRLELRFGRGRPKGKGWHGWDAEKGCRASSRHGATPQHRPAHPLPRLPAAHHRQLAARLAGSRGRKVFLVVGIDGLGGEEEQRQQQEACSPCDAGAQRVRRVRARVRRRVRRVEQQWPPAAARPETRLQAISTFKEKNRITLVSSRASLWAALSAARFGAFCSAPAHRAAGRAREHGLAAALQLGSTCEIGPAKSVSWWQWRLPPPLLLPPPPPPPPPP